MGMKDGKYPVPTPHRWKVAVEFSDGDRIEGTSDTDVLERWAKRAAWLLGDGEPPTVREMKRSIARRSIRIDELDRTLAERAGRPTPTIAPTLPWDGPDEEFLDEGAARGYWWVIRL